MKNKIIFKLNSSLETTNYGYYGNYNITPTLLINKNQLSYKDIININNDNIIINNELITNQINIQSLIINDVEINKIDKSHNLIDNNDSIPTTDKVQEMIDSIALP